MSVLLLLMAAVSVLVTDSMYANDGEEIVSGNPAIEMVAESPESGLNGSAGGVDLFSQNTAM